MNLTHELSALADRTTSAGSPEFKAATQQTKEAISRSGVGKMALQEGEKLPDFALPDASGQMIRSEDLLAHGPVILAFYRGGWCPFCNLELNALQLALPEIQARGATLVAVSPELPEQMSKTAERFQLNYQLLNDRGNELARRLGLVYQLPDAMRVQFSKQGVNLPEINGDHSWELPLPATYLVDRDGVVRDAFVDPDYYHRKEPHELVDELELLHSGAR